MNFSVLNDGWSLIRGTDRFTEMKELGVFRIISHRWLVFHCSGLIPQPSLYCNKVTSSLGYTSVFLTCISPPASYLPGF